mmetsp:Transcript_23985/g.49872  ORF Transcript_23985/g.49872 Transcript_23985/m.49872 type:complete len:566 (-) Transcript_23985:45-1742(-)
MKVAALVFAVLPALAKGRGWLPSMGDPMQSACYNGYVGGGLIVAQCGGPTTTQLGNNPNPENRSTVTEFVAITDHSIQLVNHAGSESEWVGYFSGFGTTNWGTGMSGGEGDQFYAQAYTSYVGSAFPIWHTPTADATRSSLQKGYTSYFMQTETRLGYNQFFIGSPSGVNYYLSGCPNYDIGDGSGPSSRRTSSQYSYSYSYDYYDFDDCPRVDVKRGTFKFTVLGLMSGSMINSLNSASPPAADPHGHFSPPMDQDIADYKTLLYRSTLDVGAMAGLTGGAYSTKVIGGDHDGKTFDELTATDDIAGATLQITGAAEGAINITFTDRYSTGAYHRSKADLLAEFGGCQSSSGNIMDACTRDLTGFESGVDSFSGNSAVSKVGDSGMSRSELGNLAGAPPLDVTEVKHMKITMRPSLGCVNRPAAPSALDPQGSNTNAWVGATSDCPSWWLQTGHSEPGEPIRWAVTEPMEDYTLCEAGDCWLIDFHVELGGTTEASRTVFGNPENDVAEGWQKGTFFMYDPEATGSGFDPDAPNDDNLNGSAPSKGGLLATVVIGALCCLAALL